ncbi:unnamed protein product, partial [Brassica rapa subsp. narinosa]
ICCYNIRRGCFGHDRREDNQYCWVECRIKYFWWLSYVHNNFLVFETNLNIFVKETTCTKNHHGFNKGKRSSRSKEEVFFQSRKNVSNLRFDTYIWNQNISLKSWNTSKRNTTIQVEEILNQRI